MYEVEYGVLIIYYMPTNGKRRGSDKTAWLGMLIRVFFAHICLCEVHFSSTKRGQKTFCLFLLKFCRIKIYRIKLFDLSGDPKT